MFAQIDHFHPFAKRDDRLNITILQIWVVVRSGADGVCSLGVDGEAGYETFDLVDDSRRTTSAVGRATGERHAGFQERSGSRTQTGICRNELAQ